MRLFIITFFVLISMFSQDKRDNTLYIQPEFLIGKQIPSYEFFTHKNPKTTIGFSLGKYNFNPNKTWQKAFNYPKTGVSIYFTNYGNTTKGNSITILPFLEFHPDKKRVYDLKIAFGASYFDTYYNVNKNPENTAISSDITWTLQSALYRDFTFNSTRKWRLGLVFFHHSNGHTSLPNDGINTASLSVSTKLNLSKANAIVDIPKTRKKEPKFGDFFMQMRYGIGFHVLEKEKNEIKKATTYSVSGGIFYKEIIKLKFGFNYRFYQHYYDYITENNLEPFIDSPKINASAIGVHVGTEVLLGNIGLDWEGGINIYKPFYKTHYLLDNPKLDIFYKLKQVFSARLGLKLYLFNHNIKPRHNFYIAAHINSNLSQADFSEINFGYTYRFVKKK